jgi:hypothetical protein
MTKRPRHCTGVMGSSRAADEGLKRGAGALLIVKKTCSSPAVVDGGQELSSHAEIYEVSTLVADQFAAVCFNSGLSAQMAENGIVHQLGVGAAH